ncbi:hypothetical protein [Paenibacillus cymbidii]|uniref:hypothetical protein n=1 Tax=Paenibacillus cymbidii TaxID=1639034 RepID=UPI001080B9D2|nr:hypothetical protein [Paenibacillus cymbidii]
MDAKALKAKLIIIGLNVPELLARLKNRGVCMSRSAFYRKLNGKSEFYRNEMIAIADELKVDQTEFIAIFFSKKVS